MTCLSRCMQQRLSSLHAEAAGARSGHTPQRCEQAIAMAALACFIAHLRAGMLHPYSMMIWAEPQAWYYAIVAQMVP